MWRSWYMLVGCYLALLVVGAVASSGTDDAEAAVSVETSRGLETIATKTFPRLKWRDCVAGKPLSLVVREETLAVDGYADVAGAGRVEFQARAFVEVASGDGSDGDGPVREAVWGLQPPLLRVRRGDDCEIELRNKISSVAGAKDEVDDVLNGFHRPDHVNLHWHGVHISPAEDDVTTESGPGAPPRLYSYHTPHDHAPGLHWMHTHAHGSVALQIAGGLAVPLEIVRDGYTATAGHTEDESIETVIMLQHIAFGSQQGQPAQQVEADSFPFHTMDALADLFPTQTMLPSPRWVSDGGAADAGRGPATHGEAADVALDVLLVNGVYQPPPLEIRAGRPHTLRFLNTAGDRTVELTPRIDSTAADGEDSAEVPCTHVLVARDGVPQPVPFPTIDHIVLYSGGRADVQLLCDRADGALSTDTVITYDATADPRYDDWASNRHLQREVLRVHVRDKESASTTAHTTAGVPTERWPPYIYDLLAESRPLPPPSPTVPGIAFQGGSRINGAMFPGWDAPHDQLYQADLCVDTAYEMVVGQGPPRRTHPFHMHTFPVQIAGLVVDEAETRSVPVEIARVGEWRDTFPDMGFRVRFRTANYTGTIPLHCHMNEHSDRGMVSAFFVTDNRSSIACQRAAAIVDEGAVAAVASAAASWGALLVLFAIAAFMLVASAGSIARLTSAPATSEARGRTGPQYELV